MDEKQLKLLFDSYGSTAGFKDYNEFKTLMSDSSARSVFFKESNKDLGFKDYNEFEDLLGFKKKDGGVSLVAQPEVGGVASPKPQPSALPSVSTEPPKKLTYSDINAKIEEVSKLQKQKKDATWDSESEYKSLAVQEQEMAAIQKRLDIATKEKNEVLTQYSKEISRAVESLVERGEYKNFFTETGVFDYGKAKQYFTDFSKKYGGGGALIEHWVAGLKARGEGEMERAGVEPIYRQTLKSMGLEKYVDPTKYAQSVYQSVATKNQSQIDLVVKDRERKAESLLNSTKSQVDALTQQFNQSVSKLNDAINSGQMWPTPAKEEYDRQREAYEKALADIDRQYRNGVSSINKQSLEKYGRIKAEVDKVAADPEFVMSSIPEQDRKKIDQAYQQARAKYLSGKESVRKAVGESGGITSMTGLGLASSFMNAIASYGDALSSNGYQGKLVDWMQSKRTSAEELKPAQYEWSKDPLKRAVTSAAQSMGGSLPTMAASVGIMAATRGTAAGVVASALTSYFGENTQNSGQVYRDVLERTGDVNLARKGADDYMRLVGKTLPLYVAGANSDKLIVLGKGVKSLVKGFALELAEEVPVETVQSRSEAVVTRGYKGSDIQYGMENPELYLDIAAGVIGQSSAMKVFGSALRGIGKNVPASGTQTFADAIMNHGEAFAIRLAQTQFDQGIITEAERDELFSSIKTISGNLAKLDGLGVRGDAAKLHIAMAKDLESLRQERAQEKDESIQSVLDDKIKKKVEAMSGILTGKAEFIVFGLPGDVNSKTMLAEDFNALSVDEQEQMIQNSKTITAVNNDQLNTQLQDRKLALGNPEGAPDGAYNEDATVQSTIQQQEGRPEGGVQERPGVDGGQQEVGQGAGQQGQAPVEVADTGDRVRQGEGQVTQPTDQEVALAGELGRELRTEYMPIVEKAAQALSASKVQFEVLDDSEFTARTGQSAEGAFISTDKEGKILLNRQRMEEADPGVIIWHEASHPVMNIMRNTNKPLYDRVSSGLKQLATKNQKLADALQFGGQYADAIRKNGGTEEEALATAEDESVVEAIAQIAADDKLLASLPVSLKQSMIDFVNYIAKALGIKARISDTDAATFKRVAGEVAAALKEGRDVTEIVGAENVTQFMSNLASPSVVAQGQFSIAEARPEVKVNVYDTKEVSKLPVRTIADVHSAYGGKAVVINSDPTRVGELVLPSGKKIFMYGGPNYLAVKDNADSNVGFATTQLSKVNTWMNYAKELFGGSVGVSLVATQAPTSMMSNSYALRYVMDAISMLPKAVLKSKEFKSEFFGNDLVLLKDAFGATGYADFVKKYKKADLSSPEVIDAMISEMAYKVGDNNSPASFKARGAFVSNLLGGLAAKSSLKGVEGDVGYVSKTPQKFIAKQLMDRFGINQEKLMRELGEPSLVDLYINEGKWGMIVTGFEIDPSITIESVQKGGVKHPLFNAKFPGKNAFVLDGAYEVDAMFKPIEMTGPSGAPYTKRAGQMLAGSMYVRGAQSQTEQTFEYAPAPAATTGLQYSIGGRPKVGQINWEKSPEGKGDPTISSRNPIVVKAAQDLKNGVISNEEYRATVSENSPIGPITRFFEPATLDEMRRSVSSDKVPRIDNPVADGTVVGLRLDIPAYKNNNTWVVSVHEGRKETGESISYTNVAKINNVDFVPKPKGALNIAAGKEKVSTIRMFGTWENIPGANAKERGENAKRMVQEIADNPDYVQVGMNPFRHSYFYDRNDQIGRPIKSADEVIQVGGLVYAKNPVYGEWTDEAYAVKGLLDSVGRQVQFSMGGRTELTVETEEQAQMSAYQRPESKREFKLVSFVLRKKAEGYTDAQIAFAINSALPNLTPQEVLSIINNPMQYLMNAFPGMTSMQHTNLYRRAQVANIYRPRGFTPQVSQAFAAMGVSQDVLDRYYFKAKTKRQALEETIKSIFVKGFDPSKGFPKFIMQAKEFARGARNRELAQAKKTLDLLAAAAKRIKFDDWGLFVLAMNGYGTAINNTSLGLAPFAPNYGASLAGLTLTSQAPASNPVLSRLPLEIQPFVKRMRDQIDALSRKLIVGGFVNPATAVAIEKNLGQYLTRAYRLFNEKDFQPPVSVRNAAIDYLANEEYQRLLQEFYDANTPAQPAATTTDVGPVMSNVGGAANIPYADLMEQATKAAERRVNDILARKDNPYFGSGSIESRDTGILKAKKFIPVAIRELMGEYTDPGVTFMMTITKQASLAASSQFLRDMREQGLGTLFFEKNDPNRPGDFNIQIAGPGSSSLEPLNGLYTSEEIYEALQDAEVTRNQAIRLWMKIVGFNRWGKTVGSIRTQFVNFLSNLGFAVMNGLIFTKEGRPFSRAMGEAGKYYAGEWSDKEILDITNKAISLGLVGQSIDANAIKQAFQKGDMFEMALDVALTDKGIFDKTSKKVRPVSFFNKLYRLGDDFWKVYGYVSERSQIARLRFGGEYETLTQEQQDKVDREASDRVKDTWPTYDRMWGAVRKLSQEVPILGDFTAFQAESLRVLINAGKIMNKDMKDPQMRVAGMRRAGGMLAYVGIRTAVTTAVPMMLNYGVSGVLGALLNDDDEEDRKWALKEVAPFFMRTGDILAHQNKDKPHMYTVVDMLSVDPLNITARSLNALTEGNQNFDPGFKATLAQLVGGFIGPEMTFSGAVGLAMNYDMRTKQKIYSEEDSDIEATQKIAKYVYKTMEPSTLGLIGRVMNNENKAAEAAAFAGFRPYEIDLHKSFNISLAKTKESFNEISKEYMAIKFDDKKTDEEKEQARLRAGEKKAAVVAKYHRLYSTLIKLGANPEVMEDIVRNMSAIKMTGMDGKTKNAIIDGEIDPESFY